MRSTRTRRSLGPLNLNAAGLSLLKVDGPVGFKLTLTLATGDDVLVKLAKSRRLKAGQSLTLTGAAEVVTLGQSSQVTVSRPADDGSKRGLEEARTRAGHAANVKSRAA